MGNYCQQIRERAEILDINLSTQQQQELNKRVNDRIENGVFWKDALDHIYLQMKNDMLFERNSENDADVFNKKYGKINENKIDIVEKSNVDYFITKFDEKLKNLRLYNLSNKNHFLSSDAEREEKSAFKSKEMIYIDVINSLKNIKNNLQ